MEDIIAEIVELKEQGKAAALASLVWSSGSIPMSDRAKMLVRENGQMAGTIGGGCLEAEVLSVGREVIETGRSRLIRYTMTEQQAGESGLNCGGRVRIFTERIDPGSDVEVYGKVLQARQERKGCILATLLDEERSGGFPRSRMLVLEEGEQEGSLGLDEADRQVLERIDEVLEREAGMSVELALDAAQKAVLGFSPEREVEVFVEPFLPPPVLYVFGGGHVGGQIIRLAKNVGFRVVVIDDRPAFASPDRHPDADEWMVVEMDQVFADLDIDNQSYIVAVSRGHQHDEKIVEKAIRTPARYVGMLGSERKKMTIWKRIEEGGGARERLDQVYAPIGLNIGADTPEEIAVSVVAELITVRRKVKKEWKSKKVEVSA